MLTGCLNAIVKESKGFFFSSYGIQATYEIFPSSAINNAKFWDGSGIPLVIDNYPCPNDGVLGIHDNNLPGRFDGYGITPLPNFPYAYPWSKVSYIAANQVAAANAQSPYSFSKAEDFMCPTISHEIFETLGDDDNNHYRYFDNIAPAMKHVYYAKKFPNGKFDPSGYTIDKNGVAHFPKLLDVFPSFLAFLYEEAGDCVSWAPFMKIDSFNVDGYRITNYPTRQSFNCYDHSEQIYDRLGNMKYPCVPYAGIHETIYFTDKIGKKQYNAMMYNYGPLGGQDMNNLYNITSFPPFPPNTPYLVIVSDII